MESSRNYGLDMLRVLSMLGIVSLHVINEGGIKQAAIGDFLPYSVVKFIYLFAICSVDVFAMMSGYLYAGRNKVKTKNLVSLLTIMVLYSVLITVVFLIWKPMEYSGLKTTIYGFFPPLDDHYWYITSYILLFILMPVLNTAMEYIGNKRLIKLMIVLFVMLSVLPTFGMTDFFRTQNGYSPWWLIYCYCIGYCIKICDLPEKIKNHSGALLLTAVVIEWVIWTGSEMLYQALTGKFTGRISNLLASYVSPIIILNSILILCLFLKIKLKHNITKKILLSASGAAFSVYIIHGHVRVYYGLISGSFAFLAELNGFICGIGVILSSAAIFIVCWSIDLIRQFLFRVLKINKLIEFLGEKVDRLIP